MLGELLKQSSMVMMALEGLERILQVRSRERETTIFVVVVMFVIVRRYCYRFSFSLLWPCLFLLMLILKFSLILFSFFALCFSLLFFPPSHFALRL